MDKEDFKAIGSKINRGIALLIYADPGIGKTTLGATLPVGETLIINTEAGLGPLLGTKHVVFNVNAENVDVVYKGLHTYLQTEKHPFKNVVFDNISEYEQWLTLHFTGKHQKEFPELREHGETSFKMKETMHLYRDLVYKGINVVFNAWEFPLEIKKNDGMVITKTYPKMGRKIAPAICGIVDVVGHLEVHEKSKKRWVRLGPSDQYITKSQFKGLDDGETPDLPGILQKLYEWDYGDKKKGEKNGNK